VTFKLPFATTDTCISAFQRTCTLGEVEILFCLRARVVVQLAALLAGLEVFLRGGSQYLRRCGIDFKVSN
jgi:hypothetical protein